MAVPKLRFKADDGSDYPDLVEIKIGDAIKEAKRPLDMKDDEKYQLVTVKRRNEGIISRGMFYGRDILVKNYYTVKKGDYIISKRQVIHGANGIVPPELDDAIVSNEYMVLSDSSTLLVNYLALYSMTKKMYHMFYISSYGVDIEKMFFNVDDWKKKKIMVPCIKEQQKIVELFSLIDTVIAKQKETVSAWEERKKGVMQKLFGQEVRFKADDGSNFPDWEEKHFSEMYKSIPNKQYQISTKEYKKCGKYKVIDQGKDFIAGYYDDKSKVYGSVPIIVYGDHTTVVKYLDEPFVIGADGTKLLDKISNNFDIKFLYFALNFNNVKQMGYKRHFSALKEISFTIPSSLAEQQKIADCLSSLDEVIEKQKATLAAWEELKKGLLQQMFV